MVRFLVIVLLLFALFFLGLRKILAVIFSPFSRNRQNKNGYKSQYGTNFNNKRDKPIDLVRDEKTGKYHIKED